VRPGTFEGKPDTSLRQLATLADKVCPDAALAQEAETLAREVDAAVAQYGLIESADRGRIWAYEVDGFGIPFAWTTQMRLGCYRSTILDVLRPGTATFTSAAALLRCPAAILTFFAVLRRRASAVRT
jgi:Metal-independent alpha-mannosidase (GH125)